jgi:inhibitor of cysteine peptidase
MKKTITFIATFIATILIISSVPIFLYLNAPKDQGSINPEVPGEVYPEASIPIVFNKFSSYEELKDYVEASPQGGYYTFDGRGMGVPEAAVPMGPTMVESTPEPSAESNDALDYSGTNIQVEGVDEADIIKTDGEYLYMVSNNTVIILKAYPAEEAEVLSRINSNGTIRGIFVNGDKLTVFEDEYAYYTIYADGRWTAPVVAPDSEVIKPIYETPRTSIKVYDISDKEDPVLTRNFAIDGNYFNSRMIGDYVYAIAAQYTYTIQEDIVLPRLYSGAESEEVPATDIYYYNVSDYYYTFTTIVALNIQDDTEEPNHETILLGGSNAIYASMNNIYLTFPEYPMNADEIERTAIHRISIDKNSITFEATGQVPGSVLNQFSMDEHNSYFRIATTSRNNFRTFKEEPATKNNVYVLDMNLTVVGELEDLAPGESMYSVRFIGNRGYVVTFRKVDPLFVIDLTEPSAPKVLGQLKVTGYSDYLHPYDENHLIGIGKETEASEDGDFAWYQGVKISLFDVSNVSNPVEVAKYEIGDRGTDSPVLYDHKALLFDKKRNLLVIPVLVAEINPSQFAGDEVPDWAYGEYVWQGAYVFDISLDGIAFKGGITHLGGSDDLLKSGYWFYSEYSVERSLYIDNVLYTISAMKVKMNNLETLTEINELQLLS